jgi:hypothetical protein
MILILCCYGPESGTEKSDGTCKTDLFLAFAIIKYLGTKELADPTTTEQRKKTLRESEPVGDLLLLDCLATNKKNDH